MRTFLSFAVVAVAVFPGKALAQPPGPPAVEVGVQASKKIDDLAPVTWSPRITLNLSPLTAIEAVADIQKPFSNDFATRTEARGYSLHWRQTLFTSGRWHVFGVLGAGTNRVEQDFPEQIFQGRDGPEILPPHTFVDTEPTVHLGPAVQFEAAPWIALRGDVRLTVGDNNGGLRGMVGAVVPVGRFRAGDRPGRSGSSPPLAAWQRVKPGYEVWITTTSGALVHGEVSEVSTSNVGLRQRSGEVSVALDDIRLVEGRDKLKNGIVIGGASGGIAGAVLFTWAASVFCETDDCESFEGAAAVLGAASGIAVGGLLGAMVDSLIPGRQTLFAGSAVRMKPVMTPTRKSIDVAIRWR